MDTPSTDQESPSEAPLVDLSQITPIESQRGQGQRTGRIRGAGRSSTGQVLSGHDNRAGHRLYVKVNQGRQFRKNVVGLGRWRRRAAHNAAREYGSHAEATSIVPAPARRERRADRVAQDKANRKAGLRPGWRRPVS